jgi:hypothetical protein
MASVFSVVVDGHGVGVPVECDTWGNCDGTGQELCGSRWNGSKGEAHGVETTVMTEGEMGWNRLGNVAVRAGVPTG